jgi:acyl-CoA dehydrogenase
MLPLFWNESHRETKDLAKSWAERYIKPHASDWEEENLFPKELYSRAGDDGLLGVDYSDRLGGSGGDIFHALIVVEELIRAGSVGTAVGLGSHTIALPPILRIGTEEQQERFAVPVINGSKIACLAITEPGTGSDVSGIRTTARREGDQYILDGAKTFITSGTRSDVIVLLARTSPHPHKGLTFFVVEGGTPGLSAGRPLKKMGWWASDTAEFFLDNCRIPIENRLGDEGTGFKVLMANFVKERLFLSANCVAIAQLALDTSLDYVRQREAFGRPISAFQVTRHKLAEMATKTEQARSFVSIAAEGYRRGDDVRATVAMAKNASVEACSFVTDAAVQLHGGMGYMRESLVERLYRDARLYPIGGGTTEIMREIISKALLPQS